MPRFTWGDNVQVAEGAPANVRPGSRLRSSASPNNMSAADPTSTRSQAESFTPSSFRTEVHEDQLIPLASNEEFEQVTTSAFEVSRLFQNWYVLDHSRKTCKPGI